MLHLTDSAKEYMQSILKHKYKGTHVTLGVKTGGCSGFQYIWGLTGDKNYSNNIKWSKPIEDVLVIDPLAEMYKRQKPIPRNKKNYRPTKKGAGMTKKGVAAHRRANPGSKLKTAVTGKVKKGSKAAKRRKSYCARSLGQLKKASAKTRNNPNSRIRQARRRWKC